MTTPMVAATLGVSALIISALLQRPFIQYAQRELLDHPNDRSSHLRATPRGGGAVLVGTYLALTFATSLAGEDALKPAMMLALSAVTIVAAVGWIDDRRSLGVRTRLAAHVIAGLLMLPLALELRPDGFAALMVVVAVPVITVTAINVLNFMDGIDGLITSQAAIFAAYTLLLHPMSGAGLHASIVLGSTLGFLIWNWPPARIFLGDVGSGALGVICVLNGLLNSAQVISYQWVICLPLIPIFMDASATLLRRMIRGEHVASAHRQHLYQRLANGGWGHRSVTLLYLGAALIGTIIGLSHSDQGLKMEHGVAYVVVLLATGWILDRRYPLTGPASARSKTTVDRQ